MNIKFTSKIRQNGKEDQIEFVAPVQISSENGFRVFEFQEPSQNIMNRIEVSEEKINIFAGMTSINLDKSTEQVIEYQNPNGSIFLKSRVFKITLKENLINFVYSLASNQDVIGEYDITLSILKN